MGRGLEAPNALDAHARESGSCGSFDAAFGAHFVHADANAFVPPVDLVVETARTDGGLRLGL
jgi:hypothetical protein